MATTAKPGSDATKMVDLKEGHISREIFVGHDVYQDELEKIFAQSWLFVGHESQAPKPGDYFVSCMGEESVILCRDRQSQLHIFLNSCRHRGMKELLTPCGDLGADGRDRTANRFGAQRGWLSSTRSPQGVRSSFCIRVECWIGCHYPSPQSSPARGEEELSPFPREEKLSPFPREGEG